MRIRTIALTCILSGCAASTEIDTSAHHDARALTTQQEGSLLLGSAFGVLGALSGDAQLAVTLAIYGGTLGYGIGVYIAEIQEAYMENESQLDKAIAISNKNKEQLEKMIATLEAELELDKGFLAQQERMISKTNKMIDELSQSLTEMKAYRKELIRRFGGKRHRTLDLHNQIIRLQEQVEILELELDAISKRRELKRVG